MLHELVTRDFVGLEREIEALRLGAAEPAALLRTPQLRGDAVGARRRRARRRRSSGGCARCTSGLTPRAAERVIFDLGLSRSLGYYTGAIFEVYDGALGVPLGGGGRYDDLLARFGRDLPAAGWALNVERLHIALVGEGERGERWA